MPVAILAAVLCGFSLSFRPPEPERENTVDQLGQILRHNNRGIALMERQKFEDAADEFRKILPLNPKFVPAHVNLGIAYFNLQNYEEAVKELRNAIELDPDQIHAHFMLGLIYRTQDQGEQALEEFQKVNQQDPDDPSTNYYLGLLYSGRREYQTAIAKFTQVISKERQNASARYNLAMALFRSGRREEGRKEMEEFRKLQEKFGTTTIGLQYLEQGKYSAAIEEIPRKYLPELIRLPHEELIDVRFTEVSPGKVLPFRHHGRLTRLPDGSVLVKSTLKGVASYMGSGIAFGDYDNDGWLDLFIGNAGLEDSPAALFRNQGDGTFLESTLKAGLTFSGKTMAVLWGDFNNDSFADLYLVNYGPNVLYENNRDGTFTDMTVKAGVGDPSWGMSGAFVDHDHDGDLDIFVANFVDPAHLPEGEVKLDGSQLWHPKTWEAFAGSDNVLYQNNGDGTFTDISKTSGLGGGGRKTVGVMCTDFNNTRDVDFLLVNWGSPNQLFSNLRDGTFVDVAATAGVAGRGEGTGVAVGDFNKDSFMDLVLPQLQGKRHQLLVHQGRDRYKSSNLPSHNAHSAQFLDFDNDGDLDILFVAPEGLEKGQGRNLCLLENRRGKFHNVSVRTGLSVFQSLPIRGVSVGDFDNDGDLDLVANLNGSSPVLMRNDGGNQNNWIEVQTSGTNSNKPGIGTKVEIRVGRLWQKMEIYGGHGFLSQSPPLAHFGLGKYDRVDMVRLLWPGGVLQSEIDQPINQRIKVQELDRKGTSCPILYAWNGETYQFQTDFLGGSAYGHLLAPGVYNYPDTDEYIKLDRSQVTLKEGRLAITLNNQLEEVILFDQLELVAVDHPADYEVFPDEKLLPGPPYPDFRLISASGTHPPVTARDGDGKDILSDILRIDRIYPQVPGRLPFKGYAGVHEIILDLGPVSSQRTFLLLHAWIDYADSTSNLAASQAGLRLIPPYLQVQDGRGQWTTVIERMGFPAGLPKTMTVDLSEKFLSQSRKVRIVTNMRIYWDQILVESGPERKDYRMQRLLPSQADLHFQGFPELVSPDGREPKIYDYSRISPVAQWKAHIGGYTRYGNVRPLLTHRDDMFVIARAGDEIEALFDVAQLTQLPEGWVRDYLIYVDGFGKDMDLHSARPDHIGPLPFHGMSGYPYPDNQRYPNDQAHRNYLRKWNTRTVDQWFPRLRR